MKTRNTITKGGRFDGTGCGGPAGLTITEVCCALAALALLLAVALPALGMSKGRSQRIVCVNNLSRIGIAYAMWGADHDGRRPMMTPWWEGGVQTGGVISSPPSGGVPWFGSLNNQAWFQYFWLSNELVTPKVLVCPSDSIKRPAIDWSATPNVGLMHVAVRGNAIGYIVAHSSNERERGLVSADRNIPYTLPQASCAYGYAGMRAIGPTSTPLSWAATLHGPEGNLLFNDGGVEQTDNFRLQAIFDSFAPSCGNVHYMSP